MLLSFMFHRNRAVRALGSDRLRSDVGSVWDHCFLSSAESPLLLQNTNTRVPSCVNEGHSLKSFRTSVGEGAECDCVANFSALEICHICQKMLFVSAVCDFYHVRCSPQELVFSYSH